MIKRHRSIGSGMSVIGIIYDKTAKAIREANLNRRSTNLGKWAHGSGFGECAFDLLGDAATRQRFLCVCPENQPGEISSCERRGFGIKSLSCHRRPVLRGPEGSRFHISLPRPRTRYFRVEEVNHVSDRNAGPGATAA
jgi:hypothetical protein